MNLLALDIGSSSVKAAILDGGRPSKVQRTEYPTTYRDGRAEVDPLAILSAITKAIRSLRTSAKKVDLIAATVMAPSWLAMDRAGRPLTPVVTHQDRRSVAIAEEIERRVGKARHLKLAGNRPFPGGISSTTAAWFVKYAPGLMKKAALVGHFNTFLLQQWTGRRLTDPSNASFMGLYRTPTLGGWSEELCDAVGVRLDQLPDVQDANVIAGPLTQFAASRLGLLAGTPILTGCMDTSAAMLALGAKPGQLLNVCGSTDVLAVCTTSPRPHERLLTRGLGVGRKWMSVSTLAAAGSSLDWAHRILFADLSDAKFYAMLRNLVSNRSPRRAGFSPHERDVQFAPYLAGERTSIVQHQASFTQLTLSTTREEMLSAIVNGLARASADRLPLLRQVAKLHLSVIVSGGVADGLSKILHRNWGSGWRFRTRDELTSSGLAQLAAIAKHAN